MNAILLAMVWAGCSTKDATDASDTSVNLGEDTAAETRACDVSVRVDNVPIEEMGNPTVGESWTLIMYCDETVLMGPAVLRIDPADLATLDDSYPTLTFIKAGTGEIQYQLGSRRVDTTVTIEEAQ